MEITLGENIIVVRAENTLIFIRVKDEKSRVAEIRVEKGEAKTLATAIVEATRTIQYRQH